METKNLSKSFGIRVPLDMYLKMVQIQAESKISITDICLYSLANSGILKSDFNFKIGGEVDEKNVTEIKRLNAELSRMQRSFHNLREENMKLEYEREEILKKLEKAEGINETNYKSIRDENRQLKIQMEHWKTYGYPKSELPNNPDKTNK